MESVGLNLKWKSEDPEGEMGGKMVRLEVMKWRRQEVKVIWQKAPHGGAIPRLGVTPGGRKLYHWIPGVGFPISVP